MLIRNLSSTPTLPEILMTSPTYTYTGSSTTVTHASAGNAMVTNHKIKYNSGVYSGQINMVNDTNAVFARIQLSSSGPPAVNSELIYSMTTNNCTLSLYDGGSVSNSFVQSEQVMRYNGAITTFSG